MSSLNSTKNRPVEVALGHHYAFNLDQQRPRPQLWLLKSYWINLACLVENAATLSHPPCFTCLHLQSISLHGQTGPGQHQHSRMGNHETSIVIQQALPSPQSSSVITQAPSTNRQIGWVGGCGIKVPATERLKLILCEDNWSLFWLTCSGCVENFLSPRVRPSQNSSLRLVPVPFWPPPHPSPRPPAVPEVMSGFCSIWSALRVFFAAHSVLSHSRACWRGSRRTRWGHCWRLSCDCFYKGLPFHCSEIAPLLSAEALAPCGAPSHSHLQAAILQVFVSAHLKSVWMIVLLLYQLATVLRKRALPVLKQSQLILLSRSKRVSAIWSSLNSVKSKTAFCNKRGKNICKLILLCRSMPFLLLFIYFKFPPGLRPCKPDLQTLRWLGVNLSALRQQTWGAAEYWMGGPSLSLTDTPSGSLWNTSLEFHPSGRVAITASNRASAGMPHLALPVIKTPPCWSTHSPPPPPLSAGLYDLKSLADIFRRFTAEFLKRWWNLSCAKYAIVC